MHDLAPIMVILCPETGRSKMVTRQPRKEITPQLDLLVGAAVPLNMKSERFGQNDEPGVMDDWVEINTVHLSKHAGGVTDHRYAGFSFNDFLPVEEEADWAII